MRVSVASVVIVHRILSSSNEFSSVRKELAQSKNTKRSSGLRCEKLEKIKRI